MRAALTSWILLGGLMILGTGASRDGLWQARQWQHAGDVALAGGQLFEANVFYGRVAETFPGTRHGRRAAGLFRQTQARLAAPARPSASENACSWIGEMIDFVTWP